MTSQTPTHRHKKRGTEYVLIGYGTFMSLDDACDGEDVYVEERAPGVWHVRLSGRGDWARAQCSGKITIGMIVAIYKTVDDVFEDLWVRPREEFEDGRFEELTGRENTQAGGGTVETPAPIRFEAFPRPITDEEIEPYYRGGPAPTVPTGHKAVLDAKGRATGEVRPDGWIDFLSKRRRRGTE